MRVSLIIPSHNRLDALPETLASLARQGLGPDRFEVIVVDDGSNDGTVAWLRAHQKDWPFELRLIEQSQAGPGAARNRGARAARHELLLFWDSDMIAEAGAVEAHLALHAQHPQALVAGARRPWPPACTSTFARVMYLDEPQTDQFAGSAPGAGPTFQEAFSSNLSIRSIEFERLGGFDEALWAYEDTDLAYRASQAGLALLFSREALGYHNHPRTFEEACRHQRHYQRHAAAFLRQHPGLRGQIRHLADKGPIEWGRDPLRLVLRKAARRLASGSTSLVLLGAAVRLAERAYPRPALLRFLYWKVIAGYQFIGFREGLKEEAGSRRQEA